MKPEAISQGSNTSSSLHFPHGVPGILVSVRSAAEAKIALAGGAHLIDVKEPRQGSLGRAQVRTVEEVVKVVGGSCPVSAALGEFQQDASLLRVPGCTYLKWGLAGLSSSNWTQRVEKSARQAHPDHQVVAVAYADASVVDAPPLDEVCRFAISLGQPTQNAPPLGSVLLVDTCIKKSGLNLLSWFSPSRLAHLCRQCRATGVRLALAGSLTLVQIRSLLKAGCYPDWFAVRGAVCLGAERTSSIALDKVRELVRSVSTPILNDSNRWQE